MTEWREDAAAVDGAGGKVDRRRGAWGCVVACVVGLCFCLVAYAAFAAVTIYLWRTM